MQMLRVLGAFCVASITSVALAQSLSQHQLQLCNLIISHRMKPNPAQEDNPLVQRDIEIQRRAEVARDTQELLAFIDSHQPVTFSGTIIHLRDASLSFQNIIGLDIGAELDCPPHPPKIKIEFGMRFSSSPWGPNRRDGFAQIAPHLSLLRTLKVGDNIVFSGIWDSGQRTMGYRHFGDDSNPAYFHLNPEKINKQ